MNRQSLFDRFRISVGCIAVAMPLAGWGQIYVGADVPSGAVTLSNFQSTDAPRLLILAPVEANSVVKVPIKATPLPTPVYPAKAERLRGLIESVASTVKVAPRLIHAVVLAESNYDPRAVSPKGAIGLMQLLPATARRFGVSDPFVERDNLYAGASYLKWLMSYFSGDIELVLAAYNAGEQAVVKAGNKVPQYPETQSYVRRIMADLRSTGGLPL